MDVLLLIVVGTVGTATIFIGVAGLIVYLVLRRPQ